MRDAQKTVFSFLGNLQFSWHHSCNSHYFSKLQSVLIQIRTDVELDLIWVQTVCRGYQQMTKAVAMNELTTAKIHLPHSDQGDM